MNCLQCGTANAAGSKFCGRCGAAPDPVAVESPPSAPVGPSGDGEVVDLLRRIADDVSSIRAWVTVFIALVVVGALTACLLVVAGADGGI